MKKYIKWILLVLAVFVIVVLYIKKNEYKSQTNKVQNESYKRIDNGGFYINNKGKVITKEEVKGKKVVEFYFEPACPACLMLEEKLSKLTLNIMGENTVLNYHPTTFIDRDEGKKKYTYSDNLSAVIFSMVEKDPDMVSKYMFKVITPEYSKENYNGGDYLDIFKKTYESIGGKKWSEIEPTIEGFIKYAKDQTEKIRNNEDLKAKTKNGRLSTPLLYIQGQPKTVDINYQGSDNWGEILKETLK